MDEPELPQRYRGASAEWERLVENNRTLLRELRQLITENGYADPDINHERKKHDIERWQEQTDEETKANFNHELDAIAARHGLPDRIKSELLDWFVFGRRTFNLDDEVMVIVHLRTRPGVGPAEYVRSEIKIGARADLETPLSRYRLRRGQQRLILDIDPIPQPQLHGGGRKYDWRPVREWYERNSGAFTIDELAKHLHRKSSSYVRRKLSEVASPK